MRKKPLTSSLRPKGRGDNKKAILITGAAKRVGAAIALHFAKAGYDIVLHYSQSEKEARALQKKVEKLGSTCALFQMDLNDTKVIPALMKSIKNAMPHCSILINNASVFERCSFMETDEALFDRQMTVNFKAPFFLTQAFAKTFKAGCVVNILDSDIGKTQGSHFAYLLSKKVLADFTLMAARDLGPKIRVNAVSPGCMLPNSQNISDDYEEKMKKIIPMQSHPSLDELCESIVWLVKQQHITGQNIIVDGGKHVI